MKVLVVGKRGGILQWFENVLDGFLELPDIEIKSFAVNHSGVFDRFFKSTLKNFNRKLFDKIVVDQFTDELSSFRPDLVLIVDCWYVPNGLFEALDSLKKSSLVAWWIGDLFDRKNLIRFGCVDKFYFTDSYFLEYAAQGGIFNSSYLPLASNPRIYSLINPGPRDSRLVFVGAYAENRETLLRQVKKPILVVGKRWDRLTDSIHCVQAKRVSLQKVNILYNQHIGVLNIKNSDNVVNGLNMRTFDAPASGCVVLNDAVGDLERCFEIGKELLVYHDCEELNDKIERISRDAAECRAIAEAGRRRVLAEHLYSHRIVTILDELF
jgi:spore maturation protein CgeB